MYDNCLWGCHGYIKTDEYEKKKITLKKSISLSLQK